MIRKVLAGICVFSLIYSCSREDDGLPVVDPATEHDGVVTAFVPKSTKQDWAVSDSTGTDRPKTRAWDETWRDGDKIGFYMIKTDDGYDLQDALYINKEYTVSMPTGACTSTNPNDPMFYPVNNDWVQFMAYSPRGIVNTDNEVTYGPTLFTNQSDADKKQDVDFIFHRETTQEYRESANTDVELHFRHKFSKIIIHLIRGTTGPSCENLTSVTLKNMPTSAKVDLEMLALNENDANAITASTPGDITPHIKPPLTPTDAYIEAIVPPHDGTFHADRKFVFTVDGDEYTYPLNTFAFGLEMAYQFDLTVRAKGVPLDMNDDSSNCYMITPGGTAEIPITRAIYYGGMSPTENATVVGLWDDNDNMVTYSQLTGSGAARKFTVNALDLNKEGNAVISLQGADGTIYWSWHVWVTDPPVECTNNGFTFMDRNLGATEDALSLAGRGLFYQWGRKDPFPGAKSGTAGWNALGVFEGIDGSLNSALQYVYNQAATDAGLADGILESIQKPKTFFAKLSSIHNWLPIIENKLWNVRKATQDYKTIYDPCPQGWRIPLVDEWGNTSATNMTTSPWYGMPSSYFTPMQDDAGYNAFGCTWPAAGYLDEGNGKFFSQGNYITLHSAHIKNLSMSGTGRWYRTVYFSNTGMTPRWYDNLNYACSVRCVKEDVTL